MTLAIKLDYLIKKYPNKNDEELMKLSGFRRWKFYTTKKLWKDING